MKDSTGTAVQDQGGLLFALIEKGGLLQSRLEEALAAVGLSLAKHGVLATLEEEGAPMSLSALAAHQKCVRSNITQLVDRLEHDGLVHREPDPADRRGVRAVLTSEGLTRARAGTRAIREVTETFLAAIPERDRDALQRLLGQVR